jgi:hypothetical protein
MRDLKWKPGNGSPDTSYGKRFDPADQSEPEPQTLGDIVRQRQKERTKLQDKRAVRRDRV